MTREGGGTYYMYYEEEFSLIPIVYIWHLITSTFPNIYKDNITTFYRA